MVFSSPVEEMLPALDVVDEVSTEVAEVSLFVIFSGSGSVEFSLLETVEELCAVAFAVSVLVEELCAVAFAVSVLVSESAETVFAPKNAKAAIATEAIPTLNFRIEKRKRLSDFAFLKMRCVLFSI